MTVPKLRTVLRTARPPAGLCLNGLSGDLQRLPSPTCSGCLHEYVLNNSKRRPHSDRHPEVQYDGLLSLERG